MNPESHPPGHVPGPGGDAAAARAGAPRRAWRAFRDWRRSRPFWGGLLLLLAGLELLAIPLMGLLVHSAIKIVIYIGIGGVFGIVFGGLLIACGLLSWFHSVQRIFYAVVGVLLALGSFVVTNLGGFFLGMLLGVVGASLVFGWVPAAPPRGGRRRRRQSGPEPGDGLDAVLGDTRPGNGAGGSRLLALPAVPVLLLGLAAAGQSPALAARPAAAAGDCLIPLLSFLCPSPSPSPAKPAAAGSSPSGSARAAGTDSPGAGSPGAGSPGAGSPGVATPAGASPTPDPSATPSPSVTPSPSATPSRPATGSPSPSPRRPVNPNANKKAAAPALSAAAVPAVLTAGTALMTGLSYDGVATVPTANGPQRMLKFSMSSLSLSGGIVLTVTEGAHSMVTRNTNVRFSGNVTLYATRMCGSLIGIPLCFTPHTPPPIVFPVMVFTKVTTDQPLTSANSMQASGLDITG